MILDNSAVQAIKEGNIKVFEAIFMQLAAKLERFAFQYVANQEEASDIVQNVFLVLWERKEQLLENTNLNNYLITLTKNQCLNYLKHEKVLRNFATEQNLRWKELEINYFALEQFNENKIQIDELNKAIQDALDSLPGQCREIFMMSRNEGMKYQEIAEKLKISVKTVEKKMSISLNIFREALKDYYAILLLFYFKS
jgi:RNA polymerase sigma-70 factor, ECF subfamily